VLSLMLSVRGDNHYDDDQSYMTENNFEGKVVSVKFETTIVQDHHNENDCQIQCTHAPLPEDDNHHDQEDGNRDMLNMSDDTEASKVGAIATSKKQQPTLGSSNVSSRNGSLRSVSCAGYEIVDSFI